MEFTLKPEGARLFSEYTSQNVGNNFAIVLDGNVVSAPVIKNPIPGGKASSRATSRSPRSTTS